MARRRRFNGNRAAAPAAIKVKAPKLDLAGLQMAYDWMPVNRALGFQLAFEWYGANMTALLYGDPLDQDRQRAYDKGLKAKQLGDSSNYEHEKVQAWTTALHTYERVWDKRGLPKVDAALEAKTPGKRVSLIQRVLDNLNGAFGSPEWVLRTALPNIKFRVTFGAERDQQGIETLDLTMLIPAADLEAMAARSPLQVNLAETVTLAKLLAIQTADGEQRLNGRLFMETLPKVLDGVSAWAETLGAAAFKPLGKAPAVKIPQAPKAATSAVPTLRGKLDLNKVIRVLDLSRIGPVKGGRARALTFVTDGMTVAALKATLIAAGLKEYPQWVVNTGLAKNAIALE
jgi:hypothetical protein